MDLADASLVALAEDRGFREIVTLDRDFVFTGCPDGAAFRVFPCVKLHFTHISHRNHAGFTRNSRLEMHCLLIQVPQKSTSRGPCQQKADHQQTHVDRRSSTDRRRLPAADT